MTFKGWVAIYVCTTVKAVSMVLMGGYDTNSFLVAHAAHSAVYGHPSLVTTDRGTQLQAAAEVAPNWDDLQHQTARTGTAWKFVPPGTPWRNGLAERLIQMVKRTMFRELTGGKLLDTLQVQSLLHRVAEIINARPLSARSFSADDFAALTPRDLLLGASPSDRLSAGLRVQESPGDLTDLPQRIQEVESRVETWWLKFSHDVFPLLIPRTRWQLEQPSLEPGAVVLVRYESKYGKDRYRLGRVGEVRRDEEGWSGQPGWGSETSGEP